VFRIVWFALALAVFLFSASSSLGKERKNQPAPAKVHVPDPAATFRIPIRKLRFLDFTDGTQAVGWFESPDGSTRMIFQVTLNHAIRARKEFKAHQWIQLPHDLRIPAGSISSEDDSTNRVSAPEDLGRELGKML